MTPNSSVTAARNTQCIITHIKGFCLTWHFTDFTQQNLYQFFSPLSFSLLLYQTRFFPPSLSPYLSFSLYLIFFFKICIFLLIFISVYFHQQKIKNPLGAEAENVSSSKDVTMEEEREDAAYPKTPWQQVKRDGNAVRHPWYASKNYVSRAPADGIGDLPSVFSGLHVFQNSEETCLLGCKNRRVLTRHLNQVLLRGDHVVAVALAP